MHTQYLQRYSSVKQWAVSYGVWTSGRFATEGRFAVARLVWYSEGSCTLHIRNQWHIVIQCKINWELWTKVLTGKMPLISPLIQQAHNITGFSVLIINTYWSSCQWQSFNSNLITTYLCEQHVWEKQDTIYSVAKHRSGNVTAVLTTHGNKMMVITFVIRFINSFLISTICSVKEIQFNYFLQFFSQ